MKKQLKKLGDKEFFQDINDYLKSNIKFYESKTPEIKTLAKKLHEKHTLEEFYKIYNKLWASRYENEKALAIQTLLLYKEDYNLKTWKFLKPKLKDLRSWDRIEKIGRIINILTIKNPSIKSEIKKLSKSKSYWLIGVSLFSFLPIDKKSDIKLILEIIQNNLNTTEQEIQKLNGILLREISIIKPEQAKRFILKNQTMPSITFKLATEKLKELRKVRKIKKLDAVKKGFWFFNG